MTELSDISHWPDKCHGQWTGAHTAPIAPVYVDRTSVDLRIKALELALEHWAPSGYRDLFAMADELNAWLNGQRQEPKGE